MGKILVQNYTTKNPISMIGEEAGICWGADTSDVNKNYKRGLDCLRSGHMRTAEYPQVYIVLDGYSARVIRELYTHIAGGPTRLQASTRYIEYGKFDYIIPNSIEKEKEAKRIYNNTMEVTSAGYKYLEELGIPKEDIVIMLKMPFEKICELKKIRGVTSSGTKDIHEEDQAYLKEAYENSIWMAEKYDWKIINCIDENNNIRTIEDIHEEIYKIVIEAFNKN